MTYTPKAYDVSQVTWDDVIEKINRDFSSGDYDIISSVSGKTPTFILKGAWLPDSIMNVVDQMKLRDEVDLHNIDLYVSFSGHAKSHDNHYDFYAIELIQLIGKMRYFVNDEPCVLHPGDSLFMPVETYHEPHAPGPRVTLSVALYNKNKRVQPALAEKYVEWMENLDMHKVPHGDGSLMDHSINVANLIMEYGRSDIEQIAALFHSIYGTEFQSYKLLKTRKEVQYFIGYESENIVHIFCTLEDRTNTILYGKGLSEPMRTTLRWLEYCNIKEQFPKESILKEFELVLGIQGKNNDSQM
jgi:mannose-6-phosphate isomerase-like protein (cupin superfamily)